MLGLCGLLTLCSEIAVSIFELAGGEFKLGLLSSKCQIALAQYFLVDQGCLCSGELGLQSVDFLLVCSSCRIRQLEIFSQRRNLPIRLTPL
jgi:hypothetical protein